ncbi:Aste57867_14078 [Aphanomyces stellatus]|uniref:Aste57867_14078 protein n=1 Tax=Aphanomyces stellatus TaxID=120398 RepID=A0A485L1E7_9STRA|nr:hypothetical protein As57867_014027 [Aphanomyces stellatus]VFT90906.1 Aste57867_14078 [Aphanomyces stellatus]
MMRASTLACMWLLQAAATVRAVDLAYNTDYWGNDIDSTAQDDPNDCVDDCNDNPACKLFVWFQGTCWLKDKKGARNDNAAGAVAGIVRDGGNDNDNGGGSTSGATLVFVNKCDFNIQLHKVYSLICSLDQGDSCDHWLNVGEHPMFRHTQASEATLVELSKTADRVWYDVSVVPPMCGNGHSHAECLRNNGNRPGFNVPVSVVPQKYNDDPSKGNCHAVNCPHDVCPEAYTYPFDDFKMKDCPSDESLLVTFCP